jgi:hypothetical protein
MASAFTRLGIAFATAVIAALGGGAIVFSEYDDAPGGILIGLVMVLVAAGIGSAALKWAEDREG